MKHLVFKAGEYPQGTYTAKDLAEIAASYDPDFHKAPLTVNHDQKGASFATVSNVTALDGNLYVEFCDEQPELLELNKKFKKPSIEIAKYNDKLYLHAVTLTNFPQVKNLPDLFNEKKIVVAFSEDLELNFLVDKNDAKSPLIAKFGERLGINIFDYLSDELLLDEAERIVAELKAQIGNKQELINSLTISLGCYTEAGVTVASFNEMKKENDAFKKERVEALLSSSVESKKILPAQVEGLRAFAEKDFDGCKKFIESTPAVSVATDSKIKKEPVHTNFQDITYAQILDKPELVKNFSEEQINELRAKHFGYTVK